MRRWYVLFLVSVFSGLCQANAFDGRAEFNIGAAVGDHWYASFRGYANNPARHYIVGYNFDSGLQWQYRRVQPVNEGLQQDWYRLSYKGWKTKHFSVQPMLEYRDRESRVNNLRFRPRLGVAKSLSPSWSIFSTMDVHFAKDDTSTLWDYAFSRNRTGVKWRSSKQMSYRLFVNSRWYDTFSYADSAFLTLDINAKF